MRPTRAVLNLLDLNKSTLNAKTKYVIFSITNSCTPNLHTILVSNNGITISEIPVQ